MKSWNGPNYVGRGLGGLFLRGNIENYMIKMLYIIWAMGNVLFRPRLKGVLCDLHTWTDYCIYL